MPDGMSAGRPRLPLAARATWRHHASSDVSKGQIVAPAGARFMSLKLDTQSVTHFLLAVSRHGPHTRLTPATHMTDSHGTRVQGHRPCQAQDEAPSLPTSSVATSPAANACRCRRTAEPRRRTLIHLTFVTKKSSRRRLERQSQRMPQRGPWTEIHIKTCPHDWLTAPCGDDELGPADEPRLDEEEVCEVDVCEASDSADMPE